MRRVTYLIDDKKGFSKNIDEERLNSIEGFKVYYTLEQNLSTGEWYLSPRERLMGLLFTLVDNEKPYQSSIRFFSGLQYG